ncbi:MAG: glycosyltransferase family 4 protein [Chloroflexota bacterium]
MQINPLVVIHWSRLGPYHAARIGAAKNYFSEHGLRLTALEIFDAGDEYLWERAGLDDGVEHVTLFPNLPVEKISKLNLLRAIWKKLDCLQPQAVAINGYSSWDAWCLLAWCRAKGALPVLMSDSKWDDAPRKAAIESAKRWLVGMYGAALCAGSPHRAYLEGLGMKADKIFDGYDAVDNQFFIAQSDLVRSSPEAYRNLPGLENPRPYFLAAGRFLPRKNFAGLLRAYAVYKERCQNHGRDAWRLVLLGGGPERDFLLSEIQRLGIEKDVTLAGVQSYRTLPAYYALASAFIHSPLQDQWGLVVNEAMASGLPVLVSARAGCAADLVEEGVEGFTFDPQDVSGLGHVMSRMSSGEVDLQKMGSAARRKISNWGVERFARNLHRALLAGWSG